MRGKLRPYKKKLLTQAFSDNVRALVVNGTTNSACGSNQ